MRSRDENGLWSNKMYLHVLRSGLVKEELIWLASRTACIIVDTKGFAYFFGDICQENSPLRILECDLAKNS